MANTESGVKIREAGNNRDGRSSSEIGRGQGAAVAVAVGAGAVGVMSNYCKILYCSRLGGHGLTAYDAYDMCFGFLAWMFAYLGRILALYKILVEWLYCGR
jgi:hypothetical protein